MASEKTTNDLLNDARPSADMGAIEDLARSIPGMSGDFSSRPAARLTRKEKRTAKREFKRRLKEASRNAKLAERGLLRTSPQSPRNEATKSKSIRRQLKERDKELSKRTKAKRAARRKANTVTDYIGYNRMYKDGVCEVEDGLFSQTLTFPDISYQSAREDRQKDIFSVWCGLLDYFGAETLIQLSVVNTPLLKDEVGKRRFFDPDAQEGDAARRDAAVFNAILNDKMREGVSNIKRERYITYAVSAPSVDAAVPTLARIRNDVTSELVKIGCDARPLDGTERLRLAHSLMRPEQPFVFDYDTDVTIHSGLTTKDCIAPNCIDFKPMGDMSCFTSEGKWCQVLVMRRFGSELSDRALSDIVDLPIPMCATWFVQAMDKSKAKEFVKLRTAWIDKEIIDEQRRAVSKGYDFTILPQELKYSKEEAEDVLDHLQNKNQRLFQFTGLVYTYADTKAELDERVIQIISTARRNSIDIETLDYRQREGFNSVLPFGHNHVAIVRYFTTAEAAIFIPFATQELDMPGGNYAGQNKNSNNLVICNRKLLASPVGFICGKTGSGKSFFVKQEIEGTYLNNPRDQVIIFDRAGEYRLLAKHLSGTEIRFAVDSTTHLNPFDMSTLSGKSRESQIAFKIDAMLAQAAASAAETGQGLDEGEQSIIARAVELAFARAESQGDPAPLLGDFHTILLEQPEPSAKTIALRYERFVQGAMSFFNNHSNVDWSARCIDINIKELPDSMLVFTLISMCEAARNQMYKNFEQGIRTWIYIEEIQSLFKYPTVLNYFSRFANEARKFGGLLTGITQNSVAMLENEAARSIVLNADFIMLLKQSAVDRKAWVDLLGLSVQEAGTVDDTCDKGSGLLIAGAARVPIIGGFPKGNELYDLFSTDPNDVEDAAQKALFERKSEG